GEAINMWEGFEWMKLEFSPKYELSVKGYLQAVGDVGAGMLEMVADGAIVLSDQAFRVVEHVVEQVAEVAAIPIKKLSKPIGGLMWAAAALAAGGAALYGVMHLNKGSFR